MRPVGYGRPGTPVFPPGWQDTHGRVIEATLDCDVTIGPRHGEGTYTDDDGQTHTNPGTPIYTGAAAISPLSNADQLAEAAADQVPTRRYLIELPVDVAAIDPDTHVVRVTVCTDAMLTGSTLSIDGVLRGSTRFTRLLQATLND